ncbi:MAG: hypothetical protein V8R75_09650 [Oscillospiraceae bacterium]
MDVEYLLYRVYGGTNWYTIEELEQPWKPMMSKMSHLARFHYRNERDDLETMVQREEELAVSDLRHSLLPSPVKHPPRNTERIWQSGAFSALCSSFPQRWCGTGCGTPGPCSGSPAEDGPF